MDFNRNREPRDNNRGEQRGGVNQGSGDARTPYNRGGDNRNSYNRGGFNDNRGGGGFNDNRGGFNNNRGGGFNDNRGGFSNDRFRERTPQQFDDSSRDADVYSEKVRAGKRTYFLDVKETRTNDFYLTITESKRRLNGDGYEKHKIFLYKEDFNKFLETLTKVINHVKTEILPEYDFDEFDRKMREREEAGEALDTAEDDVFGEEKALVDVIEDITWDDEVESKDEDAKTEE